MTTALTPHTTSPHDRLTIEDFLRLYETGVLPPDDRSELLDGVVVPMSPKSARHDGRLALLADRLRQGLRGRAAVREEKTLHLGAWSAPEPDIAVVVGRLEDYLERHPETALLVVELAVSSLSTDRVAKHRVYAAASIPEYWLVNLRDAQIEVHRDPDPSTRVYRDSAVHHAGDVIAVRAFPDVQIAVADVVPPRAVHPPDDELL